MAGLTNRGKKLILDMAFRAQSEPVRYYVHLLTSSATITADTNTWSDISANEISGGGYGEATAIRGIVDFDVSSENDSADQGEVQLADVNWTAVGSSIIARYAALTDDAGGSGGHADNNVIAYWDFGSDQTTTATNVFTLSNFVIRIDES